MKFPVSHIKKLFKIKTLKNKFLISYTLVIIAAITTVGYVSYSKASHSINEELKRNTAQIIIQISNSIDTFVSDLNRMALVINSDEELLDILKKDKPIESLEDIRDYQKVQRSIQNASGFVPNIAGFNIFASDGRTFSMGNRSVKLNYDFTKTLWYKQLQNKDSIFIGTHFQEHVIDAYSQEVISLAKVIKDRDTLNIIGYVLIDCDTRTLESIFGSRKGYDKSSIFLVGTQNELIYSSKYQVCSFEQIKDLVKEFENLNDVGFSKHKVNGIEMLFSFYTSDLTGWKVVDAIPLYVVNENINDITNFSIIITFISLIVTIIISSLLAISITRPLTRLSEKMKVIEQGNFNVSVGFESDDEVGQLGRNFDRMVGKINEMIKKVYEAEFAKKEAEINALQAQINPHFLYNTLAAIDSIATLKGDNDISEICRALSKMFKYNVEMGDQSTIGKEIENIRLYLFIEKIRYGNRFDYDIQLENGLEACNIKKLLIQPIVENAIVHGVEGKCGKVTISINVRKTKENTIEIIVHDTGKGIDEERLNIINRDIMSPTEDYWKKGANGRYRVGLKNVNYRIKLNYGDAYGLRIHSVEGIGTIVILTIPEVIGGGFNET